MNAFGIVALALALAQGQAPAQQAGAPQQAPPAAPPAPAQAPAAEPPQAAPQEPPPGGPPEANVGPLVPAGPVVGFQEALQAGAASNLDLQAAKARLRESYQITWKAWSGYLPQISAGGSYTRNNVGVNVQLPVGYALRARTGPAGTIADEPADPAGLPGAAVAPTPDAPFGYFVTPSVAYDITIQKLNQLGAQVQATQAIIAPALWLTIRNAYRAEHIADLTYDATRREVLFAIAQSYYGTAALKKLVDVSLRLLDTAQRQERDAQIRFKAGTIAKVGLLRAEIDRARAEQDVVRAKNAFESARLGLAMLLDRKPDFEVSEPPEPTIPADASALEDASVRRPDVEAARQAVDLARTSRSAVAAGYLPNLGAFGRWQWANVTGFTGEYSSWAVGLALQWNVFDGGLREANLREAGAKIAESEAQRRNAELRARTEVRQALLDYQSAKANARKSREQRDLAAENQRLIDVSYRAGAATALEQADATDALRNAEIAAQTDALQAQLAAVRVLKAAGEFDPVPR